MKIIREYIKSHASTRATIPIQKIAVCGKGGVGKSTISTLLAQSLENAYAFLSWILMNRTESLPVFWLDRQPNNSSVF